MNFLAHIFLSDSMDELMVGNFIGDFVKGKKYEKYATPYKIGILLHREIDSFTDSHPTVNQSKDRLRANYRHYAGVVTDMFYDHFLATNWLKYSNQSLESFVTSAYSTLQRHKHNMPLRAKQMLPYMIEGNWLLSYSEIEGIDKALNGMSRRTKFKSEMEKASTDLVKHYNAFNLEFNTFFPDIITHSNKVKEKLLQEWD